VSATGVDPLRRRDVCVIAGYAIQRGVRVSMTPPAAANVTKEAMQHAKDIGLARWAFSTDGHCKEVHDYFRGTSGSFDFTMTAIEYLHELDMPLQINTVISKYNYPFLDEMAEMVERLDCVLWSV